MIELSKITGRLGNQLFQFAFAYNYARQCGIDRYFQDPIYFRESENEIKFILQQGIPEELDMVAIHVRRGDYVGHALYVDLMETTYYQDAMAQFPNSKFVVFSDDIEWCKKQDIFKDCEFMHGTELEDINNMASCNGHIIANSSFSYWGAYLSPYTRKVIAPKQWYTDGVERTVLPDNFIQI